MNKTKVCLANNNCKMKQKLASNSSQVLDKLFLLVSKYNSVTQDVYAQGTLHILKNAREGVDSQN